MITHQKKANENAGQTSDTTKNINLSNTCYDITVFLFMVLVRPSVIWLHCYIFHSYIIPDYTLRLFLVISRKKKNKEFVMKFININILFSES